MVIILLTDGMNNAGRITPEVATDLAKAIGVKIYTIGAGSDAKFVRGLMIRNKELDEETLKRIAAGTGGKYFRAMDTEGLKEIYDTIDELEKTELKVKEYMEYDELVSYFLMIAMAFILLEVILANTRFQKIP